MSQREIISPGIFLWDNPFMQSRRLAFAVFAAAILFSMIRQWSVPASCARAILIPTIAAEPAR